MKRIVLLGWVIGVLGCGMPPVMSRVGVLETSPQSVDFGTVSLGARVDASFVVRNVGAGPVSLVRATIEGDAASDFSFPGALFSVVGPGEEVAVVVRFNALAERARVGRVVIETDSPITPTVVVPVTAVVVPCSCATPPPCMQVSSCVGSCAFTPIPGCVVDAGFDAGADAGLTDDAGVDAGEVDAGSTDDAGADAGVLDAGSSDDAGVDAGELDAGPVDAGLDAGAVDAGGPVSFDASVPRYTADPLSVSPTHACAVVADGGVRCWGRNDYSQLGTLTMSPVIGATPVQQLQGPAVGVLASQFHSCALLQDGRMSCWGTSSAVLPPSAAPVVVPLDAGAVGMGGTLFTGCAITGPARDVYCWGTNYNGGAVGNGTTTGSVTVPALIVLPAGAAKLAGGIYHQCALLLTGEIYCWGANDNGQLGNGQVADAPSPVRVLLDAGAVDLSTSSDVSCALKANQRISCWGYNGAVVIHGDAGAVASIRVPVDHWAFPSAVRGVGNGGNAVLALELDGGLSCFSPTDAACARVSGGPGVSRIDVGPFPRLARSGLSSGCALQADAGTLCWGANLFGIPGTGTDAGVTTPPIRPPGL